MPPADDYIRMMDQIDSSDFDAATATALSLIKTDKQGMMMQEIGRSDATLRQLLKDAHCDDKKISSECPPELRSKLAIWLKKTYGKK